MSRFRFVAAERAQHQVSTLCRVLRVSAQAATPGSAGRRRSERGRTRRWVSVSRASTARAGRRTAPRGCTRSRATRACAAHAGGSPVSCGCGGWRARSAGATIVADLENMFWGDRTYVAEDLEGHRWTFAEHVKDVAPEDMKPPA